MHVIMTLLHQQADFLGNENEENLDTKTMLIQDYAMAVSLSVRFLLKKKQSITHIKLAMWQPVSFCQVPS